MKTPKYLDVPDSEASLFRIQNRIDQARPMPPSEAEELFEFSVSAPVVPLSDLYGSKICAALDRQHPRDLFDILILLENEGITDKIRKSFLVFLASHNRPMHELIKPTLKDISDIYEKDFKEMVLKQVPLKKLIEAREELIKKLSETITTDEKKFLLSLKKGNPHLLKKETQT